MNADSMKQAAALLKTSVARLKKIKQLGCPAFKSGRVDLEKLKVWLLKHRGKEPATAGPPGDKESLTLKKMEEQIALLAAKREHEEIELAAIKGVYRNTEEIKAELTVLGNRVRSTLQFQLLDRLPAMAAGRSAAEIRELCNTVFRDICAEFFSWVKKQ